MIDIRAELEAFEWTRARWTSDKLIAASPFRYDNKPSFFVNLETGGWHDSGAIDSDWASGNIYKLLAFLRNETEEETRDYLRCKYYADWSGDVEELTLDVRLPKPQEKRKPLDSRLLESFKLRHPYLGRRGISEAVQRKMRIGYDKRSGAVTIPWFLPDGRLANVKYRRTDSKIFWYQRGGVPVRELVYGIDVIYRERARTAVLVEGEIDAMYVMETGYHAIAVGGSAFTDAKADLIKRSTIDRLIVSTDNDEVGRRLRDDVIATLSGFVEIYCANLPEKYKDPNEVKCVKELRGYLNCAESYRILSHRRKVLDNICPQD